MGESSKLSHGFSSVSVHASASGYAVDVKWGLSVRLVVHVKEVKYHRADAAVEPLPQSES